MRVVTAAGETIELGDVETTPTIGITDYSRRVTDDFGVTTIVERGFARKMSVKLGVPFDDVDVLQRRLASLRATPALWVADDRFASLSLRGFYKEFEIDLAVPPLSYCTLTVEGLAEAAAPADPGGDPAPAGLLSTLQLLQPVIMTNSVLSASNIAENDAGEWAGATSYPIGARVMKAATHRIYESLVPSNTGNDPAGTSGKWLDIGPTNRWAMFDQALGTSTSAVGSIVVTLDPGTAGAVALLDVSAATVRVQANGYDRTQAAGAGAITFLDLPAAGQITVTIAGQGTVSVGTLLVGRVVSLGITEASPTAGITDFSKKTIDDFGDVAIVERAFTKRMTAKALIRTNKIDQVANRIAAVRARPSLWIGQAGVDSLTVYGFFKDFSIEVGETLSKLSLSIEGLSTAAKVEPLKAVTDWADVRDPLGTKPQDNATVGAPPGTIVGDLPAETAAIALKILAASDRADDVLAGAQALVDRLEMSLITQLAAQQLGEDRRDRFRRLTHLDGLPLGTTILQETRSRVDGEARTTETFSLLGERTENGQAFILSGSTVMVSPTKSLAEYTTDIEADFRGEGGAVQAAVGEATLAIAGEDGAIARSIATYDTSIIGPEGRVTALVAETVESIVGPDGALAQALTTYNTSLLGPQGTVTTTVQRLDRAISDLDGAVGESITDVTSRVGEAEAAVQLLLRTVDGKEAIAQLLVSVDGKVSGFRINGAESEFLIDADRFIVGQEKIFSVIDGVVRMANVEVERIKVGAVDYNALSMGAVQKAAYYVLPSDYIIPRGATGEVATLVFTKEDASSLLEVQCFAKASSPDDLQFAASIYVDGNLVDTTDVNLVFDNQGSQGRMPITPFAFLAGIPAGSHTVAFRVTNNEVDNVALTIRAGSTLKVNELRKGSIGSLTGGGGPITAPGGGTGGGGSPGYEGEQP